MDDFNAAFGKIDETLKANADAVAGPDEGGDRDRHCADDCQQQDLPREVRHIHRHRSIGPKFTRTASEVRLLPRGAGAVSARTADRKRRSYAAWRSCSSGIGSMNNYYTWGDSGVSRVSQTLDSDSGGYMASSQFNTSGKEYCCLVLGYDADWIKQKTAPSLLLLP